MAELSYCVSFDHVAFGTAPKSLAAIFNGSSSGRVLRIYKIYVMNGWTGSSVSGGLNVVSLMLSTSQSSGTAVTPTKYDTTSEDVPAQVLFAHGATVGDGAVFRTILLASDDLTSRATTVQDDWQAVPSLQLIYDTARYSLGTIQPLTLREGQGIHVKFVSGTNNVGQATTIVEFTSDSS